MTHLQEQLDHLRDSLSGMGSLVEKQLAKCMEALINHDVDLANEVIRNEKRVNVFELQIDKECENIFALLTPVAHDMRLVFATLKINADMERIGDYAEGIARTVLHAKGPFNKDLIRKLDVVYMYEVAFEMLKDVFVAYSANDARLARSVFSRDLLINNIHHKAVPVIVEFCKTNPDDIEQALGLLSVVRKLERVGDHITNIAEEIIFFREAEVLKHGNKGGDNSADL